MHRSMAVSISYIDRHSFVDQNISTFDLSALCCSVKRRGSIRWTLIEYPEPSFYQTYKSCHVSLERSDVQQSVSFVVGNRANITK